MITTYLLHANNKADLIPSLCHGCWKGRLGDPEPEDSPGGEGARIASARLVFTLTH